MKLLDHLDAVGTDEPGFRQVHPGGPLPTLRHRGRPAPLVEAPPDRVPGAGDRLATRVIRCCAAIAAGSLLGVLIGGAIFLAAIELVDGRTEFGF
jgi:hypothetical protein